MTERLIFLLGKDPATERGGDLTMAALLQSIARQWFDVGTICLSTEAGTSVWSDGIVRVSKPRLAVGRLALRSITTGRSMVHTRFDVAALRRAIETSSADRYVAIHPYMAEAYLHAVGVRPQDELVVSTEVSESAVWAATRRGVARVDLPRLRRDELRVARAARSVGAYDQTEVEAYRSAGVPASWLDVTLPPAPSVDVAANPPRLVLLGNRMWSPNSRAAESIISLWPRIAKGIPDAQLVLIGSPSDGGMRTGLPEGVADLGFVDDVDNELARCRALVVPVSVGGGVRVKVLEAAARGLPVVATRAAVGSTESALGVPASDGTDDFIARCREMLLDPHAAVAAGCSLHEANRARWDDGVVEASVRKWLQA